VPLHEYRTEDWPRPAGRWPVKIHIETSSGVPRVVGISVGSTAHDARWLDWDSRRGRERTSEEAGKLLRELPELTTADLRTLQLPALLAEASKRFVDHYYAQEHIADLDVAKERVAVFAQRARRWDLDHFKEVARIYTAAYPDEPTKAVAEALGLTRTTAAKHVARCRELGLLGRTVKGRAGLADADSAKTARPGNERATVDLTPAPTKRRRTKP